VVTRHDKQFLPTVVRNAEAVIGKLDAIAPK
jgi:hypothetical protein